MDAVDGHPAPVLGEPAPADGAVLRRFALPLTVLVTRSPWFGLFALTGYIHTYELLSGRWRVVGVTATAALHVLAIFGGRLPDLSLPVVAAYLVLVAVSAGLALGFSR